MPDRTAVIKMLRAAGVECYNRDEWGTARESEYVKRRGSHPMPDGPADYHFLHITVTGDTDSVKEGKDGAKQIESYGLSTPKMVSYHGLTTNEAKYFQGQDYGTKGTHTINDKNVSGFPNDLNLRGYAIALMQNVGDEVTDLQVKLIAMIMAAEELTGWVKKGAAIYPHRKFANKSCPGDKAVARLEEIFHLKTDYVKEGKLPMLVEVVVKPTKQAGTKKVAQSKKDPHPNRDNNVEQSLAKLKEARRQAKLKGHQARVDELTKAIQNHPQH